MYCPDSDDCSRNGVRCTHGDSRQCSSKKSQSAGTFSAESPDGFELGNFGTHGVNDPPTPKISAERDGSVSRKNDWPLESAPVVGHVVRSHVTCGEERAG